MLIFDTYSLMFRAHYALPPMTTRSGRPTSALYGLSVLLRERRPESWAFAMDRGPSFRESIDPAYKAHRGPTPGPLAEQLEGLSDLFSALGVAPAYAPGFEADDVIATLVARYASTEELLVVSGDRDLFQVIGPRARVLFVGRRGQDHVLYDEARVDARYGLAPTQLPSLIALVGDKADNIPKVPGVGDKSAARWLQTFGDAEGILSAVDRLEPARLRSVVRDHAEQIRRSARLALLSREVPYEGRPTSIGPEALTGWKTWFEEMEFRSLQTRLDKVHAGADGASVGKGADP